jgi:hypothetical protein
LEQLAASIFKSGDAERRKDIFTTLVDKGIYRLKISSFLILVVTGCFENGWL